MQVWLNTLRIRCCAFKGDIGVKLSTVLMGAGYLFNAQLAHGIFVFLIEIAFIVMMIILECQALAKFSTLGTVKREQILDPLTIQTTVNDYDNSFMILAYISCSSVCNLCFVLFWISNIKNLYKIQMDKEKGIVPNKLRDDLHDILGKKFHLTLLSLPVLGVILMNIIPIFVLIAIAFTNYDQNHMPPK